MLSSLDFWVAVSFVGFIALIVYFKVPGKVTGALDDRAEAIRKELDEARRLREDAQAILADYQRKQRDAEREAESIIKQAKAEAKMMAEETRASLKDQLERRTELAQDKIARAEAQALNEVRTAAIDVAIAASERIIGDKLTPKAADKLIADSIGDLKTKLN